MQYTYKAYNGAVEFHRKRIQGFYSLYLFEIRISDQVCYSINNVAQILGYRAPQNLHTLLKDSGFLLTAQDLYRSYMLDAIDFGNEPDDYEWFLKTISSLVDDPTMHITTRTRFLTLDGILFVMAHNTMTSERVKKAMCTTLGIDKSIICPPRPETNFCDRLSSMLGEFGYTIQRQYPVSIYRLDMAVFNQNGKFLCAVEFDEDTHRWYNEDKEKERSTYMNKHRIKIIHADKYTKPETVLKTILKM